MTRAVTMADVAARAGVSTATVSLVLSGRQDRSTEETAARVRTAAQELGYVVDASARSLRTRRTQTIGFVSDAVTVTRNLKVWIVIVFVLFSWTFYQVFDQQMFPAFYTSMFSSAAKGQQAYGVLNSIQVFLEAVMMGVVPFIMKRIGPRNTLLLGVTVMFIRIGGCAVLHGPVLISCVKMLHSFEVPLFVLGIFGYFAVHFNPGLSATLYLVAFNLAAQVGQVVISTPLGTLRDHIGYQHTFLVVVALVACAAVFAFFALKKDDQDVEGVPFVREVKHA